jgi:hypothetical protein
VSTTCEEQVKVAAKDGGAAYLAGDSLTASVAAELRCGDGAVKQAMGGFVGRGRRRVGEYQPHRLLAADGTNGLKLRGGALSGGSQEQGG